MEILIHHVSYSDVVFVLENARNERAMCRCRGDTLDKVCNVLKEKLSKEAEANKILLVPFLRADGTSTQIAAGFDVSEYRIPWEPSDFRNPPTDVENWCLKAISFPIFALTVYKWVKAIHEDHGGCDHLKVYFLSGAHQRLTEVETCSTRTAAELLMRFAQYRLACDFGECTVRPSRRSPMLTPSVPRVLCSPMNAGGTPLSSSRNNRLEPPPERAPEAEDAGGRHTNPSSSFFMTIGPTSNGSKAGSEKHIHHSTASSSSSAGAEEALSPSGKAESVYDFFLTDRPKVSIVLVHSGQGVFRYDENVKFVNSELMPNIDADRTFCQREYIGDNWASHFSVTLTLAEGAPARISAITQCLIFLRPNYIHILRPKLFIQEQMLQEEVAQFLSFDSASTVPPIKVDDIANNPWLGESTMIESIKKTVEEMRKHQANFLNVMKGNHEMCSFWLRKTHKPVLAVLMVQKPGEEAMYFRGINMEVSMPTGSLCAERSCISSALAHDPMIKRSDLKMIAVLSLPSISGHLSPQSLAAQAPSQAEDMPHLCLAQSQSCSECASENKQVEKTPSGLPTNSDGVKFEDDVVSVFSGRWRCGSQFIASNTQDRKILWAKRRSAYKKDTLNPIDPCGACNEWLKKIVEVQPQFKVINFVSDKCDEIFVKRVR